MQYFTRAWCVGEYTDEEFDAAVAAYSRRLDEIAPRLPPDLLALSGISLNDAWFRSCTYDQFARQLTLRLRCGDLQRGYFDLSLRYDDVTLLDYTPHGLAALVNDPGVEVQYDEVDAVDGARFEHRMIFWPEGEVTIQFAAITLTQTNVAARYDP